MDTKTWLSRTGMRSALGIIAISAFLLAGAAASAGPLAQLMRTGFLAAYPAWFAGSVTYVVAVVIAGLLMRDRVKSADIAMIVLAFTLPIFISGFRVIASIAPAQSEAQSALLKDAPVMHALIVYIIAAVIFSMGARDLLARRNASQQPDK